MWQELLAGLAGGAQGGVQGLGLIQDQRQQQLQNQLRERQAKLQEDEARRAAVKQAWDSIQEGHSFEAPEQVQQFVDLGYGVVKGPDGRPMKPKSVQTQAAELGLKNTQNDIDFETKQREMLTGMLDPGWAQLPIETKQAQVGFATGKPEALTPEQKIQYDSRLLGQQAAANARVQAEQLKAQAAQARAQQGHEFEMSKLKFLQSGRQDEQAVKLKVDALKAAQASNPFAQPADLIMSAQELYNGWLAGGGQSAPAGGKYQIKVIQ